MRKHDYTGMIENSDTCTCNNFKSESVNHYHRQLVITIHEPPREKTNNVVSEQV